MSDFFKSFCVGFCITLNAITIYNIWQCDETFDRCEELAAQIDANLAIMEQELASLNKTL